MLMPLNIRNKKFSLSIFKTEYQYVRVSVEIWKRNKRSIPFVNISASADGGPRSPSARALRVRSSPHRH